MILISSDLKLLGQAKVDNPQVVVVVGVGENDVEWFEVQMNNPLAVDELNTPNNLGKNTSGYLGGCLW